ncbi:MAG TPA: recombination-associated protein RdgC [Ideonella sp.]|nr:recombination-associated protein RdgC [Ideonella sp.]
MFKNLLVYRVGPDWSVGLEEVEESLAKERFVECGATQASSAGWVEPRGHAPGPLVESIGGQWLMKLMVEQKVLPGAVVKRRSTEIAEQIEKTTGRKPGKKQGKEIKEQAVLELLPMAFTKQAAVNVWLDPKRRLLMIDTSSATRAESVVTYLVKALDGFAVTQFQTTMSPAAAMSAWLASGEPPSGFTVDRECELKSADEMKSVVRYSRHLLDIDEVRQHIQTGKQPTKLAMTWQGRVSFMLTDALQIKKLGFEDVVFENSKGSKADTKDDGFDTDAAIATGELCQLIPDLVEALDGELAMAA